MEDDYGGVIWTKHALFRLKERSISQGDAWYTWKNPQNSRYAASKKAWIYYRTYNDKKIEVVATKNDSGKWIILSVWSRPIRTIKTQIPKEGLIKSLLNLILLKKRK